MHAHTHTVLPVKWKILFEACVTAQSDKIKAGRFLIQTPAKLRVNKPAPKHEAPREIQANCYMPHLSAAIWLDSDLEKTD